MAKKYTENYKLTIAVKMLFSSIEGYETFPIHDVIKLESGDGLPKHQMIDGLYPVYGGGGRTENNHNEFNVDFETIGIGRVGARCGCVFTIEKKSWVTDNALYAKKIDNRFTLKFLKHFLHHSKLNQYANVAMQPVISKTGIRGVMIPLLPIEKQIEIGEFIEDLENNIFDKLDNFPLIKSKFDLLDKIDNIESENKKQFNLLSQLRKSILQEAIQGKLTILWRENNQVNESAEDLYKLIKKDKAKKIKEKIIKKEKELDPITADEIPHEIPENWVWCRLGELYSTTSGGTPLRANANYWFGDITWFKSGELTDTFLDAESEEKISEIGLKESSATLFPKGTLLIAMYGATAGKLSILNRDASTNQAICGFFYNEFIETKYLFYFLMAQRAKMISDSWGMSQPNISQTYLRNFVFALPPREEQKIIIEKVELLMNKCLKLSQEIETLDKHGKTLMKAMFNETFETKTEEV